MAILLSVLVFFNVSIPFLDRTVIIYSIVILGVIAILINLLNVRSSKHSVVYSVVYWLACLLMILGLGQLFLGIEISYVLFAGVVLMLISFFIPKYTTEERNEDVIDDL